MKEMGNNQNPMYFGNPQNEGSSFLDVSFPHSVPNYTHNMSEADHLDLERLTFRKCANAEVN